MIKLLLKHALAETAINVFFEKLINSFSNGVTPSKGFNVGDRFHNITIMYIDETFDTEETTYAHVTFYDCEIMDVYSDNIHVKYQAYEEDIYDEDGVLVEEMGSDDSDLEIIELEEIVAIDV